MLLWPRLLAGVPIFYPCLAGLLCGGWPLPTKNKHPGSTRACHLLRHGFCWSCLPLSIQMAFPIMELVKWSMIQSLESVRWEPPWQGLKIQTLKSFCGDSAAAVYKVGLWRHWLESMWIIWAVGCVARLCLWFVVRSQILLLNSCLRGFYSEPRHTH